MEDMDWEKPTERVVERKEKDRGVYHVKLEKVSRKNTWLRELTVVRCVGIWGLR